LQRRKIIQSARACLETLLFLRNPLRGDNYVTRGSTLYHFIAAY